MRSNADAVLINSANRFVGWRSSLFHHGPLFFVALLIAENFGLFDRN